MEPRAAQAIRGTPHFSQGSEKLLLPNVRETCATILNPVELQDREIDAI